MSRLLVIDTETGGLDPERHSILSLGAVVWADGKLGETFEVRIVEPEISVEPEAMAVNRINLEEHQVRGQSPPEAVRRFLAFLDRNFGPADTREKIDLVGHNIMFDVGFLRRLLRICGGSLSDFFSHRYLDTAGIVRFLILAKKVSMSGASSNQAFEYFGVSVPPNARHTALGDAIATAKLLNALLGVLR